ncbi:MAG: acyl-CoA dehydrogenase family protein [Chitinophagales bacterium]|nr:acyl-CoA dehydrogenase family protein [Chitinophagales bacterium]
MAAPALTGGNFLFMQSNPNDVFIPEEFSEEQRMIFNTVKEFMLQEVHSMGLAKLASLDAEKDKDLVLEIFRKASELGLCGVSIDEQYGGMGLDFNTGLLFTEALALGFSFATTIGCQTSIGSLPILWYGTEAQKKKYLPAIASGEKGCSYCLTEPTAGSDANSGKTRAVLNAEGTHYILNGQKMWITNGGFAEVFTVFAKIDNDEKLSAFIVEKSFGGIELGKEEKKMGIKASSTVQVFFNNCKVPKENLLGDRGKGFNMALNILNSGRIKIAAGGVGGMKFGLEKCVEYTTQRQQFGKPISDFGAIKQKIGTIASHAFAIESGTYRIGAEVDKKHAELKQAGSSFNDAKINSMREYAIECAILKVLGSEAMCNTGDEAIQMFGGMGYSQETGVEMAYRDARITKIYEGTNEINRMLALGEFYKRAFVSKEINLGAAKRTIPAAILQNYNPFKSGEFATEWQYINNLKALFMILTGSAGNRLREKLVDEQEIVMNLADVMAMAFVTESAFLRVMKLKAKRADKTEVEMKTKMAQAYLYDALDVARKAANNALDSYCSGIEKAILKCLVRRMLRTYNVNPKNLKREVADYLITRAG